MTSLPPKIILIQIESLSAFYLNLARALTETGISGSQLNEILTTRLQARCVRCEIQVTSAEIEQIALVENLNPISPPKLKRLRLGYCARDGCESDTYQIHLEAYPGVDWEVITTKANNLILTQKAAAKGEQQRQVRQRRNQQTKRAALGLLTLAISFLLLFFWRHGRLPFVKKPHKYQIDPALVRPGPQR